MRTLLLLCAVLVGICLFCGGCQSCEACDQAGVTTTATTYCYTPARTVAFVRHVPLRLRRLVVCESPVAEVCCEPVVTCVAPVARAFYAAPVYRTVTRVRRVWFPRLFVRRNVLVTY